MRRICFFIVTAIAVIISSCTVNNYTGLIVFENQTDSGISNIKLGDFYLAAYLAPGAKYENYFVVNMTGKLTSSEAITGYHTGAAGGETLLNGKYTLKPNNWYHCYIRRMNGKNYIYIKYYRQGDDIAEHNLTDPEFYKE